MTAPTGRRMPAEWEHNGAVLIAWPHAGTDWSYMLDEVTACYIDIARAITDGGNLLVVAAPDIAVPKRCLAGIDNARVIYCQVATNDTWARDFGPITVVDGFSSSAQLHGSGGQTRLVDFCFNAWGLKFAANHDNLITSKLAAAHLFAAPVENRLGFVLEGGSIESDGAGTILTTSECLLSPNRNGDLSRGQIEDYLREALGADRFLWLDHGYLAGDDTDSHIDTLARFAPGDTIIYVKCDNRADEHYRELAAMEEQLRGFRTRNGNPYNLVALPLPDPIYDENGDRLPATYANFLITDTQVLLPVYGQKANDLLAEQILRVVFHDREIVPVDCRALIRQHGSLHCVTMQLQKSILPL